MATVELDNLTKTFPSGKTAVDRLQLTIADGELLVLVGPSGCGKTTTLRMVAGLEQPTSGTVRIGDRDVTRIAPRLRNVAMVFQDAALMPHLSVRDNLAFGLRLRKVDAKTIDERVRNVADMLDLNALLARRPHEISGGQRRRAALGRALVHDADCLLLDEPLSHLDADARRQLRDRVRDVHRRTGRTMLYVTHDQEEAMAIGQRIAVLHDGVLQQCAPPLEVYRQPANRFVAGFIGGAPMNFIAGILKRSNERLVFQRGDLQWQLPEPLVGQLPPAIDSPVVLGVRPESLHAVAPGESEPHEFSIVANIEQMETLGDRVDLHLSAPWGETLLARVPASDRFQIGEPQTFAADFAQLHLFAAYEAGQNLRV